MKSRIYLTIVSVLCLIKLNSGAAFNSIFVFGDGLSCTVTNVGAGPLYYGKRYTNGRTWVEVLAQMQGIPFDPLKNTNSFFGNTSSNLPAQMAAFKPPTDAANSLVVIWVNNADLYYPAYDSNPTFAKFNFATTNAVANQQKAITTLYSKGIRTLVMPNVVDITMVPEFNTYATQTNLIRQACTNYNAKFYAMIKNVCSQYPDLLIVVPDYFSLLEDLLKSSAKYGLTNALYNKLSIDAVTDPALTDKSLNGPGANYVFWDSTDPSAKVHYIMANFAQQLLSPVRIGGFAQINGSNRIDMVNLPVGASGSLENCTNLAQGNWITVATFGTTQTAQSILVPTPPLPADFVIGPSNPTGTGGIDPNDPNNYYTGTNSIKPTVSALQLYRLNFHYNWMWP